MNYSKATLLESPVFRHFDELCHIPHVSGNEKALSDHILAWAMERGLQAEQDAHHNLYIRKPASKGYENAPSVMLQAHLDMVGDQLGGGTFDFAHQPIEWIIEGDTITTGGKTTLGADDGAGVALIQSILEDDTLAHPALEVALTAMEEVDFSGADKFDFPFTSELFINLDGSYDTQILCSSSGGMDADVVLPLTYQPAADGSVCARISVAGLAGGHSGREINRGHDSAIAVMGRFLLALSGSVPFLISRVDGGNGYTSISRDASAEIVLDPSDMPALRDAVKQLQEVMRQEHPRTGSGIEVSLSDAPCPAQAAQAQSIIAWLTLSPNGIVQMNEMFPGVVESSVNLGTVKTDEAGMHFKFDIRSLPEQMGRFSYNRIALLAKMTGASCATSLQYPSWTLREPSALRSTAVDVYRQLNGSEPEVLSIHVGLEVGYFCRRKPQLDAISIGPLRWGAHGPAEAMNIPSLYRCFEYLKALLAAIR